MKESHTQTLPDINRVLAQKAKTPDILRENILASARSLVDEMKEEARFGTVYCGYGSYYPNEIDPVTQRSLKTNTRVEES